MRRLDYRIVNVFAAPGQRLSGNALAVFEDAEGLTDAEMAALALQLNLAETTFLFPSAHANARVRIFTPTLEMPFAGHPSLGSAYVVRALARPAESPEKGGDDLVLEMKAGDVRVTSIGDRFQLTAPSAPSSRPVAATATEIDAILELPAGSTLEGGAWVHTGVEQLVVPLASVDAVRAARPDPNLLGRVGSGTRGEACMYVFAEEPSRVAGEPPTIVARFFYLAFGAAMEDPATGSACANLGGWMQLAGRAGAAAPSVWNVEQGDLVGRPSRLHLTVEPAREEGQPGPVRVAGDVLEIGRGSFEI